MKLKHWFVKNSPTILIFTGISGLVTAGVMASKKTLELSDTYARCKDDDLTRVETAKIVAKSYIPSVIIAGISIACICAGNKVTVNRHSALLAAYNVTEASFRAYRDETINKVGQETEKTIRDEVSRKQVAEADPIPRSVIRKANEDVLMFEPITGTCWDTTKTRVDAAVNEMNKIMLHEGWVSLNDWFHEIGMHESSLGEDLGWHIDHDYIEISYVGDLNKDYRPVCAIQYRNNPRPRKW